MVFLSATTNPIQDISDPGDNKTRVPSVCRHCSYSQMCSGISKNYLKEFRKITINLNTTVYLLKQQLHVSAIQDSRHQAVYRNKTEIDTVVHISILKCVIPLCYKNNKTNVLCIYRQNTTLFIGSIIGYLMHWAHLHVSAANAGHLQAVHGLIE